MQGVLRVHLLRQASSIIGRAVSVHPDDKKHSGHLSHRAPDLLLLKTAAAVRHKPEAELSLLEDGKRRPPAAAVHPESEGAPGGKAFGKYQQFLRSFSYSTFYIFKSLHILEDKQTSVKVTNDISRL